jgi:uncharacterized metal-binding protein YceD (DUF177 family)
VQLVVESLSVKGFEVRLEVAAGVDVGQPEPWAVAAAQSALDAPVSGVTGVLRVERSRPGVKVTPVGVEVATVRPCDRCGADAALTLSPDDVLTYLPIEHAPKDDERELSSDELDVGWFHDGVLDMTDVFGELLVLSLPARVVCADVAACDAAMALPVEAEAATGHPAFAAFAALKRAVH